MEGIPEEPWATAKATHAAKFGNLSQEQIARVERIEADYRSLERDETYRNKTIRERDLIMGNLADERRADLVKALGEEGYFNYMARSSEAASHLKQDIQGLRSRQVAVSRAVQKRPGMEREIPKRGLQPRRNPEAEIARQSNRAAIRTGLGAGKISPIFGTPRTDFPHALRRYGSHEFYLERLAGALENRFQRQPSAQPNPRRSRSGQSGRSRSSQRGGPASSRIRPPAIWIRRVRQLSRDQPALADSTHHQGFADQKIALDLAGRRSRPSLRP